MPQELKKEIDSLRAQLGKRIKQVQEKEEKIKQYKNAEKGIKP